MGISNPVPGFDPIQLNSFMQEYGENVLYDDFLYGTVGGAPFTKQWSQQQSGGSAQFNAASNNVPGHPGILELDTVAGPPATNKIGITQACPLFPLSNSYWSIAWLIRLPVLSGGADTFIARAGIGNISATLEFTDGVYFGYTDSVAGGNWELSSAKASVRTKVNSGIAPVANAWTLLQITGTALATASYFVNGVNAGTITTNLPSANIIQAVQLFKTAGNANVVMDVDTCYYGQAYANFR
jgi:hypothetical protein